MISIIIPTKNEEKTIGEIIERVRPYGDEIIVVDSKHTTDNTRKIAEKLGVKVLVDNGKGKGEGIRIGIEKVEGDVLVFFDADGSHEPTDIPKLVKPIVDNKADLVIASRILGGSDEFHGNFQNFSRNVVCGIITLIINCRFGVNLSETQNGFRAIRAKVARELNLKANTFDIETELIMKCLQKRYIVSEIPSHEYKRVYGRSGVNLLTTWHIGLWRVLINLF